MCVLNVCAMSVCLCGDILLYLWKNPHPVRVFYYHSRINVDQFSTLLNRRYTIRFFFSCPIISHLSGHMFSLIRPLTCKCTCIFVSQGSRGFRFWSRWVSPRHPYHCGLFSRTDYTKFTTSYFSLTLSLSSEN